MQTEQAMAILIAIRPPILHALPAAAEMEKARVARAFCDGGEGGIRTPVAVTRQDAFEAPPLRPLRYLSVYWRSQPLAARLSSLRYARTSLLAPLRSRLARAL